MTVWNNRELFGKYRDSARSTDEIINNTDNFLTSVVDLDARQNRDTVFTISNIGLNSLYYVIKARNEYTNGADFVVFSNEVVPNDQDEAILVRHARIFIFIQSHVLDNHTTCKIEAIGGT